MYKFRSWTPLYFCLDISEVNISLFIPQDDGGWTPIIWASEHKLVNAVKFLCKNGADPHLKDKVKPFNLSEEK